MSNIPIRDITQTGTPASSDYIVFDNGQMRRGTVGGLADAVRPVATQSEAQAGVNNTKTMTPLRTKDSIAAEVGVSIASKAQGDLAASSLQPGNIGSSVQAYDADLVAIAGLSPSNDDIIQRKAGVWTNRTLAQIKSDLAYGTAANFNVGVAAGNIVQLDGSARLPAIDGSQLTNLPAAGGGLIAANNLSDVANRVTALNNLRFLSAGTGAIQRGAVEKFSDFPTVLDFGAKADGTYLTATVSISAGSPNLTATGAAFVASDVAKVIVLPGAGAAGTELVATIIGYTSASQVTLNVNAATTVAAVSKVIFYGTDNTSAFNNALTAFNTVIVPNGNFAHSGTISIPRAGSHLIGFAPAASILTQVSKSATSIQVAGSIDKWGVKSLSITRASTATAGFGIYQPITNDGGNIDDVFVSKHYVGVSLSSCAYARFTHSTVQQNVSHGIQLIPDTSGAGTVFQWNIDDVLSQVNGGDGFLVTTTGASTAAAMGDWLHVSTFGNTGYGMRFLGGSGRPINNLRISKVFIGGDGNGTVAEIYLDTYAVDAFPHNFTDVQAEQGYQGFAITSNNTAVNIINPWVEGMSQQGIISSATKLCIIGGHVTYNTLGISIQAGRLTAIGTRISNSQGAGPQTYGIAFSAASGPHIVMGCDFNYGAANSVAPILGAAAVAVGSKITDNIGYNPVGAGVVTSSGSFPYSYTAGPSPEDAYFSSSTNITSATINGGNIFPVAVAANSIFPVRLGPGETVALGGSGTLTHTRMVH